MVSDIAGGSCGMSPDKMLAWGDHIHCRILSKSELGCAALTLEPAHFHVNPSQLLP